MQGWRLFIVCIFFIFKATVALPTEEELLHEKAERITFLETNADVFKSSWLAASKDIMIQYQQKLDQKFHTCTKTEKTALDSKYKALRLAAQNFCEDLWKEFMQSDKAEIPEHGCMANYFVEKANLFVEQNKLSPETATAQHIFNPEAAEFVDTAHHHKAPISHVPHFTNPPHEFSRPDQTPAWGKDFQHQDHQAWITYCAAVLARSAMSPWYDYRQAQLRDFHHSMPPFATPPHWPIQNGHFPHF